MQELACLIRTMKNESKFLDRPSSFWITILTMVLGGVIAFTTLAGRVDALEDDQQFIGVTQVRLESKLDQIIQQQQELYVIQAKMQKDIEFLKVK